MIIYDTTLRDGEQSPDVKLSMRDKLEIAKALDDFKVDYIELGWPASNEKEMECFLQAYNLNLKNAKIAVNNAINRPFFIVSLYSSQILLSIVCICTVHLF